MSARSMREPFRACRFFVGTGVAIALTVMLVLTSTASYAVWTASATKGATASPGTLGFVVSGVSDLSGKIKANSLSKTAVVSVQNTGSVPLTYTLAVTGAAAPLASRISMQVWRRGADCATPSNSTTGTLASPPALPADASSSPAGGTVVLCVRTTLTGAHANSVGLSVTPTVTITGNVGTTWSVSAANSFTQSVDFTWFQIVHDYSGKCLDGFGEQSNNGTDLIIWTCKELVVDNNQAWRLDATTGSWVRVTASYGGSISWRASGSGNGSDVQLWETENSQRQEWSFTPHGAAGHYQIRNRFSDRCLSVTGTTDETVAEVRSCSSNTNSQNSSYREQHFRLVEIP